MTTIQLTETRETWNTHPIRIARIGNREVSLTRYSRLGGFGWRVDDGMGVFHFTSKAKAVAKAADSAMFLYYMGA